MPFLRLGKKNNDANAAGAAGPAAHLRPARSAVDRGDPVLGSLLGLAAARDWTALRAGLEPYRDHDLSALIAGVCTNTPRLSEWMPRDEDDALTQAVLGCDAIERGWRVRSGLRATRVSAEQFEQFHRLLRTAEDHLYASAELDPELSAPWYSLLITARGLEFDLDLRQRRFDALTRRAPDHLGGHRQMLQNLCEKWSGSHERMHAFATGAMRGPFGATLAELVPDAHIEHWLELGDKQGGRTYMQGDQVRAELIEAAGMTVFRPGFSSPRSPYWAANLFAMAFGLAGLWEQSVRAFELTEGVVLGRWVYMSGNEPEKFYTNWRNHVIQKAKS